MALDETEQELFDFAMASMPPWFKDRDRTKEEASAMAKQMGSVKKLAADLLQMCLIGQATGPTAKDTGWDTDWATQIAVGVLGPDWLNLHAADQATARTAGEDDATMRRRLQSPPTGVTRSAILAAAQAMVDAAGVTGTVAMVEFPRDAAYTGAYEQDTGHYGTFYKSGTTMTFVPNNPFKFVPYFANVSGRFRSSKIVIASSNSAGNDGTFTITGLSARNDSEGNPSLTGVTYTNASGVAEADGVCSWEIQRLNARGVVVDGWGRAFTGRGYRTWRGQRVAGEQKAMGGVLLILPYGSTEALRLSIREMLRQKKAAGIAAIVERRMVP